MTASRVREIVATLTPRETRCAFMVFQGRSDREIMEALGVSFATLRVVLRACFDKIGADTRMMLCRLCIDNPELAHALEDPSWKTRN